jgi:hypothetical protein
MEESWAVLGIDVPAATRVSGRTARFSIKVAPVEEITPRLGRGPR